MTSSGRYQPLDAEAPEDDVNEAGSCLSMSTRILRPVVDCPNPITQRYTSLVKANAGLLLVAASQAFFALMNVAVKKLNSLDPPVPTLELVAVRMGITYICCISYLLWKRVPNPFLGPKDVRLLLVFRGFSGFFGLFGIYYSLQYLSLSDATVLTFLSPLTTALAGYFFLSEVFKRKEAVAGVLSLVGVILIARPEVFAGPHSIRSLPGQDGADLAEKGTPGQRLGAVGIALLGVLGATGAYTSLRAIGKPATVGMLLLQQKFIFPTRIEWLALLAMIGIFGFLAQVLLTMGLQRETASRGSMAIYAQIIFASILERIFFHTIPSALSITGTVIIMGSALFVAITKQSAQASASGDAHATSEIPLDLELGVVEPETHCFLAHVNASHLSLRDEEKDAQSKELGREGPNLAASVNVRSKSELLLVLEYGADSTGRQLGANSVFGVGDIDTDSDADDDGSSEHTLDKA